MAVYGYLRVSGNQQESENQRFQLLKFANENRMRVDRWVDETVSTRKSLDQRRLSTLLAGLESGDVLLVSEITRLGRNLFEIMSILNDMMKKGVTVHSLKEGYRLGDDINSKILAFAFGLAGEIERNLISIRTKEALERRRAEGKVLGRPIGRLSRQTKLSGKESEIRSLLEKRVPIATAARILGVHRTTLDSFVKTRL
jgi:DNA invertase Pin-like site-specific DNA recombinase